MHAVLTSRNGVGSLPNTLRTGVWDCLLYTSDAADE